MAVQFPLPGAKTIGPLGLEGPADVPYIAIDPNARATLGGFTEPTTLDAGGAKLIDLTAREKLGGFSDPGAEFDDAPPEADPGNEFDTVDDLDARSVEELDKDRDNFDPVSYFDANPDVAENPARLKKLLDVRRLRDKEGLVASRVVKAATKDPIGAVTKFGAGARDFVANVVDVALQPTANVVLGAVTGDLADPQRRAALFSQTRKDLKKSVAEIDAAAESEALGTVDLGRQGLRKIDDRDKVAFPGRFTPPGSPLPEQKPKTDQDLLQEISDDVAFRKQASEVLSGEGEMAKAWGLDQTTLAKEGITLDKEAIENISLVGPLTMVASAGVYTLVGASGKVLATARTLDGVKKVSAKLKDIANSAIGRPIQLAGKLTTFAGESTRAPGIISGSTIGSIAAGNPAPIATALAVQAGGKAARVIGPKIEAAGAKIATEGSVAVNALSELAGAGLKVAEGPALGALTAAPLAAMTDDDNAAGSILGAGIAFGGAAKGFQVVSSAPAKALFGPNRKPIADVPSAAYGRDAGLDLAHQENIAKLPVADRAELNNFRELVRPGGGEIYVTDRATFRQKVAETFAAETGKELTPEALNNYEKHYAFFDEAGPGGEKIVYLNSDVKALQHDSGHIFDALLSDEKRAELRAAVKKAFSEDDISAFKKRYEEQAKTPITEKAALNEYVAETFAALFRNVPANELAAPKTLLSKFGNAIAGQAEKWGVDLTGGATTPNLGAPVSVEVRTLFRDAARTVAEAGRPEGTSGARVGAPITFPGAEATRTPPPVTPEPPAPTTPPVAPTVLPEVPLGVARKDVQNPALRSLSDAQFDAEFRRVTKELDALEGLNAEGKADRSKVAEAQDQYGGARLERLRRNIKDTDPNDLFRDLRREPNDADALVMIEELERQGVTREKLMSGMGKLSPDEAEIFRGQLERIAKLANPPASPIAGTTAPNIRVTKAQQDSFSHRNAETGVARARELAASDPVVAARVEEVSRSLESGNPVLEIEHRGIVSETPAAGRRTRVGEQEAGYAELERLRVENRAEAPASVVATHSKTFVPVRWDAGKSGTPALIAVSLDKTISNIHRVAKESVGKGVEDLIPYKIGEDGKFTADSWDKIIKDNQAYGENHANGYRGDGKKLVRPGVDVGLSIPAENPNYVPTILSDDVMNFQNLIQGLNTPSTAREVRGQVAGNIKGQIVAEVNNRTLLEPASIRPRDASKQSFASFPGRTVKEVNPMRRDLIAKGVDIDKLIPVVERIRAKDIASVKSRPDLNFKAPVTDIVRGGFLPAPTEFRSKNLQGRTVSEFSEYILNASPEEWKAATENMTGGLTGGAWNLGLGLKDAADLGVLKTYQEKLSTATKEAMQAGNFDAAYSLVSKGQFFRESYEAGSGTGSAGAAFKRGTMGTEGVKVPFPTEEQPKK